MSPHKGILVINAGSSSIKFAVFGADLRRRLHGELEGIGTHPRLAATGVDGTSLVDRSLDAGAAAGIEDLIRQLMQWLEDHLGDEHLTAIGHRVGIGGLDHTGPVMVDSTVLARLKTLIPLAPLHQPRNLEAIEILRGSHGHIPQVACFDTAFHRTLPRVAQHYALPGHVTAAGAHRYGFHGISYEYIASTLAATDKQAANGRTVVAHLGSGASMCALQAGKSIATTMGFSPLSGLVMGTRPGDLDPGLMIWLIREQGMSVDEVEAMLYHDSGLKGVSGISNDMRDVLASNAPDAQLAVELFVYKISTELGALAAALSGLDALIFTAGIGENAPEIRRRVCQRSEWLGIRVDPAENLKNSLRISTDDSAVAVYVIPTNEEFMVARHTAHLVHPELQEIQP